MGNPTQPDRYHALDALRAAMMFAVVVLHAAMLFASVPVGRSVFRFADPDGGPEFFALAVVLQVASMPAFFLTAGFFAAMLAGRRGVRAMLANRLRRVALPFVVFWPVLSALTVSGLMFGCAVADEIVVRAADDTGATLRTIASELAAGKPYGEALEPRWPRAEDRLEPAGTLDGRPDGPPLWLLRGPGLDVGSAAGAAVRFLPVGLGLPFRPSTHHLIHLWFLWVLTLLVAVAAAVAPVAARVPTDRLGRRLASVAFPLAAAVPLAAAFAWHEAPVIPPAPTLLVPPATLFAYGLFFAAGALLWRHRDRLPAVGRHWPVHLALGLVAFGAALALVPRARWWASADGVNAAALGACACAAVAHWQFVWASVGLFNRVAGGRVAWVRYLADASYWVYLVHLPVVLWVGAALLVWPASRFVKFPVVLGVAVAFSLVTYHYGVRGRTIGRFLNGSTAAT